MDKKNDLKTLKGIFLVLAAAAVSGVAIYFAKISVMTIEPLILTTSRNLYVALIFLISLISTRKIQEIRKLKIRELLYLVVIGVVGGALPFYLFFSGVRYVQPGTANLIHKTLFIWVSVLAVIFLKERFKVEYLSSFLLIIFGNFCFTTTRLSLGKGELMILAATFLWAVENIIAKKVLSKVSSDLVGLFRMGIGSLILLVVVCLSGQRDELLNLNPSQLKGILTGGSILFFYVYFWYKGLKYAPASLATAVLSFSVVVGSVLSGAFAGLKIPQTAFYSSIFLSLGVTMLLVPHLGSFPALRRKLHG